MNVCHRPRQFAALQDNINELRKEVNGAKVLKSEDGIRALLSEYGITSDKEIVAHCQTGIRSAYATLVLLGLDYGRARNYDGSWIEWANNPSLPVSISSTAQADADSPLNVSQK